MCLYVAGDGPPVCGNNAVEAGESCDDGNTTAGDGCSERCALEDPPPEDGGCCSTGADPRGPIALALAAAAALITLRRKPRAVATGAVRSSAPSSSSCRACDGLIPAGRASCPHCDWPVRRGWRGVARVATAGAALMTLMACYGMIGRPMGPDLTDRDGDGVLP